MTISENISKHFKTLYFGGNWTEVSFKSVVADVNWQQATQQIESFNSIVALVYHTHYFVKAQLAVLQGQPLKASDAESFNHPPISSEDDWQHFLTHVFEVAEAYSSAVAQLSDVQLNQVFVNEAYGTYYSNIQGMIEHCYYHLGQLSFLKKML